ncbi:sigma-70 family RNA polymerase sigma factor [Mycobacterium sp. ACS4054]|uniref:sigma-70 family RNA polymerase sigma factor n=1 Tax=Mycobacterium sp. ACS4054 TaxID=1834119 RepID=UPI0018D37DCB|nr:sigma-70 family RNA polymerase sigma factor [Mycobacterium sp. ACS4054]
MPEQLTAGALSAAEFEQRVTPHTAELYRRAMRLTSQHADAEDLVQDTLVKAFAAFGSFRSGTDIGAWLYRILINAHISNYRRLQRRPTLQSTDHLTDAQLITSADHSPTGLPSAEDQVLRRLGHPGVVTAMRALPEQSRTAVYYADVAGLSCREIAALMGTPLGTVVSRLHRGRRRLRWLLTQADESAGYVGARRQPEIA